MFDYIQLTDDYSIYEIPVPASWKGKSIVDVNVRRKYKINIIAVKVDQMLQPTPEADYVFGMDDHIVVIGKANDVLKLTGKRSK